MPQAGLHYFAPRCALLRPRRVCVKTIHNVLATVAVLLCLANQSFGQTANREWNVDTLYGSWRWIISTGSFAGVHLTPENLHIHQTLIIGKDQTESLYQNDSLIYSRHIRIYRKSWNQSSDSATFVHITDYDSRAHSDSTYFEWPDRSIFLIHEDTLQIRDTHVSDGMNHSYVRIRR